MKKYTFFLLLILLTGCAASRKAHVSATPDGKQYVVILSMDAFRWDLAGRSHTPTLDSLARAGTYAEIYPVLQYLPEPLRHGDGAASRPPRGREQ